MRCERVRTRCDTIVASLVKSQTRHCMAAGYKFTCGQLFYSLSHAPQTTTFLSLVKETSKAQSNRNTVIVITIPPRHGRVAQLRPCELPPENDTSTRRVSANPRETRSTASFKSISIQVLVKRHENAGFPLHKLPREIMDMIIKPILISRETITISKSGSQQMPGILQVSYEIRQKYLKVFYSSNRFRELVTGDNSAGPMKWIEGIVSDHLRHVYRFTFDYRLTSLDYRRFFLRLSRTDEENQQDEDGLYQMCRNVRVNILSSLRIIANADMPQYPLNIHLHVDLLPQDIPNRLRIGRSGLAGYLSIPIAGLIVDVEEAPDIRAFPARGSPGHVTPSIRQGRAMRSHSGSWSLAAAT